MKLKVNHPDNEKIMQWLYVNAGVIGNEDHLVNALLTDFLSTGEIYALEKELFYMNDFWIDLPKDLTLVEDYKSFQG